MAKQTTEPEVLEFDFTGFKARDFRDLNKALREGDIDAVAQFYARLITACPWGDARDPETYLSLDYVPHFNAIAVRMAEAMKDASKK